MDRKLTPEENEACNKLQEEIINSYYPKSSIYDTSNLIYGNDKFWEQLNKEILKDMSKPYIKISYGCAVSDYELKKFLAQLPNLT